MQILTLNKKNITDFADERNKLLSNSKSDWNLFLDKDETLSKSVSQLFINPVKNKTAYYLTRRNYFLGQYVGTDKIIRLVKKGTGKWVRAVHEKWLAKNNNLIGVIDDNFITHNTADNLTDYINKINNYSSLHAKANYLENKKSSLFKIIFFPIAKFIVTFIKSRHLVFSIMQSLHSYLSWTKLYFGQF